MLGQLFKRLNLLDCSGLKVVSLVMLLMASIFMFEQAAFSNTTTDTFITDVTSLKWEPWDGLPEGAEIAVIKGKQQTSWQEAFVRIPAGYQVPHHHHGPRELVIWMQGEFTYVDDNGMKQELGPMAYLDLAPGTKHSVRCGTASPCIMYLKYDRPFDVHKHPHPANYQTHAH